MTLQIKILTKLTHTAIQYEKYNTFYFDNFFPKALLFGASHDPRHVKPQTPQTPDTSNPRHIKPKTHQTFDNKTLYTSNP